MKQYQNDYSAVAETKEGKATDILVETFGSEMLRTERFKQYCQWMKGER